MLVIKLRQLMSVGRPPKWTLVTIPLTAAAEAVMSVWPPLLVGRMVDGLTAHRFASVLFDTICYLGAIGAAGLVQLASGYGISVFREGLANNLRQSVMERVSTASFDSLRRFTSGEISNRVISDVNDLSLQIQYAIFPLITAVCTVCALIVSMLYQQWCLALLALALAVLTLLPIRVAAPRIGCLKRQQSETRDALYGQLQEDTSSAGLRMLRDGNARSERSNAFHALSERIRWLSVRQVFLGEATALASVITNALGPATVMAVGAYFAMHGKVSAGTLITLIMYQGRLTAPLGTISSLQVISASVAITAQRLTEVLNLPREQSGGETFNHDPVRLCNVDVRADGALLLQGVSVCIKPGESVALVGPSGAGKTTLASLLVRLHDPASGTITIGDREIAGVALGSLRSNIAFVTQESLIVNGSIRDNVTLSGRASDDDIWRVLRVCGIDDTVRRLPRGLDTRVGQVGLPLSAGERQRLCLARAALRRPMVLVLDEALSGVDLDSEGEILRQLRTMLPDTTTISITHRTNALSTFDRVICLKNGSVVAEGHPDQVLQRIAGVA